MSHAKRVLKRKRQTKAVTALGVGGLLSLTSGASAEKVDVAKGTSTENAAAHHEIILEEEEFSDVSLGTFYLLDKKTPEHVSPACCSLNTEGAEDTDAVARAAEAADTAVEAVEAAGVAGVAVVAECFSVGGFGVCGS
jgi:hypothetical protein